MQNGTDTELLQRILFWLKLCTAGVFGILVVLLLPLQIALAIYLYTGFEYTKINWNFIAGLSGLVLLLMMIIYPTVLAERKARQTTKRPCR